MAEHFFSNQQIYYQHSTRGWTLGTVKAINQADNKAEVLDAQTGTTEKISNLQLLHGLIANSYDPQDPELFRVGDLHVATLLFCIKERYEKLRLQYSRMGEMILSVNPFQAMPFNSDQEREKYLKSPDPLQLAPHVWQIAHKAFVQIIVRDQGNQSVVISGESGSGKTENTKMLINYLGQLSFKHSCNAMQKQLADRISDRLKWSNPILESFGNARTVRNDNSSRFGKYTKLFFDPVSGVMVGGEMVTYLLEKSRIIGQAKGERNYHVFYEMLAGLTPQQRTELGNLRTARDYRCLNRGETFTRRGVDGRELNDADEFRTLCTAFSKVGFPQEDVNSIFKALAAILHLQDISFVPDANDKATIENDAPLETACSLLGIQAAQLKLCFLEKSRTKILTTLANKAEAEILRDAFCKGLYVGLFDSLVTTVNASIKPVLEANSKTKYIGVLDIFGFENFAKNSFEQLCIDYCNEALQNHYNKFTFLNDEEECKAEGIQCPKIEFPNNQACLQMFEQPKTGIFALLDEECNFKGGTSQRFTSNVWQQWTNQCPYFIRPKSTVPNEFGVKHYAANVNYNTEEWLEKNADSLKEEARQCLQASPNPFIRQLLDRCDTTSSDGQGGARRRVTVAIRFQKQLTSLRGELESTESHFVRCVKPNMDASPATMDNAYVGTQLESAGVLQTIALKRQGYPIRRPLKDFAVYFTSIAPRQAMRLYQQKNYREAANAVLSFYQRLYTWPAPNFAVGKGKVFLRANVWSTLEKLLLRKKRYRLRRVVPYLKRWVERFRRRKAEEERRRQEEQRLLQENARQREQGKGQSMTAAGRSAGLNEQKAQWFEDFAQVFPYFDIPVLLDVVYGLPTREQALAVFTDMQAQRLDKTLPSTLKRIFQELGVRNSVVETLAAKGIVSLSALSQLSDRQLHELGMNDAEIRGLMHKMLSQQSQCVITERLQSSIGTAAIDGLLEDLKREQSADSQVRLKRLTDMGYPAHAAKHALAQCNGDVAAAGQLLLQLKSASPLMPRTASNVTGGAAAVPSASSAVNWNAAANSSGNNGGSSMVPSPNASVVAPPTSRPSAPQSRPTGAMASANNRPPPPGTAPRGGAPAPPSPTYPAVQQQQQRVDPNNNGQSMQQQRPATGSAGSPSNQAASAAVDPAKVQQLVSMGFAQAAAVSALRKSNGDLRQAANRLLEGV